MQSNPSGGKEATTAPYRLGVEEIKPDHWVAYALDLPGCFASAATQDAAVAALPARIHAHRGWLQSHGRPLRLAEPVTTTVAEVHRSFISPNSSDEIVNACFDDDRRPLGAAEAGDGVALLGFARRDLLALLHPYDATRLTPPVAELVRHIGGAEWWYLDTLGLAFPRAWVPDDPLDRITMVRDRTLASLPRLAGDTRIAERSGEYWSPRKLLRRALWHERDHTAQIAAMLDRGT